MQTPKCILLFFLNMLPHILLVDDDHYLAQAYRVMVEEHGLGHCHVAYDGAEAKELLKKHPISAVVTDLQMPNVSGEQLLQYISEEFPEIPSIVVTQVDEVSTAVNCMKHGAVDYMTKPVDANRLVASLRNAITIHDLKQEVQILNHRKQDWKLSKPEAFSKIVTHSPTMRQIFAYMEAIAPSPKAVLVTGESGTGKELVAHAIHRLSGRPGKFIPVNVSGVDDTVFADTLFGHRRGSFTGADSNRRGLIEQAIDGTLFLDEIGDMDPMPQIKLLRLLQEGEYYPLGSDESLYSSSRIVAATNANLLDKQSSGIFRKDLYYRLVTHRIDIPPLRDRAEDIPLLLDHFIEEACTTMALKPPKVSPELLTVLESYSFPGNVRELQALAYDAASRYSGGTIPVSYVHNLGNPDPVGDFADDMGDDFRELFSNGYPTVERMQTFLFTKVLRETGGNQSSAAKILGVSQSTLSRWIRQSGFSL